MKLEGHHPRRAALSLLAPALTVLLLLLAVFPLSMGFLLQPGIAVNVPSSPFLLAPQRDFEVVSVTSPPGAAVYFQDAPVAPGQLRHALAGIRNRTKSVIIKADRDAPYGLVVQAMNDALAGGFSVVLATTTAEGL